MSQNKSKTGNPFFIFTNPIMYFAWKSIKKQQILFNSTELSEIGDFETDTLIPGVLTRLEAFKELFGRIKKICSDVELAKDIDSSLREVLPESFGGEKLPQPQVGVKYLKLLSDSIDTDFLPSIDKIMSDYSKENVTSDFSSLAKWLTDVKYLCSTIEQTERDLFYYHFKAFPIVRHSKTGEQYVSPPISLRIILVPFEFTLKELVLASQTLILSIDGWAKNRQETKKKFVTFLTERTKVSGSNVVLVLQILTIILAVCLSAFFLVSGDPFTLYRKNKVLNVEFRDAKKENHKLKNQLGLVQKKVEKLQKLAVEKRRIDPPPNKHRLMKKK